MHLHPPWHLAMGPFPVRCVRARTVLYLGTYVAVSACSLLIILIFSSYHLKSRKRPPAANKKPEQPGAAALLDVAKHNLEEGNE